MVGPLRADGQRYFGTICHPAGTRFLSSIGCVALLIDMIVATLTSAVSTLPKGLSFLSWLDDFLYLPEVLYVLFFIWLLCSGPGKFSVDYWLIGKLLR